MRQYSTISWAGTTPQEAGMVQNIAAGLHSPCGQIGSALLPHTIQLWFSMLLHLLCRCPQAA